jgi:hypothetical protein
MNIAATAVVAAFPFSGEAFPSWSQISALFPLWQPELDQAGVSCCRSPFGESQMESMADPSTFGDLDENDPKSIGRWMRKMSREMGEDLGDDSAKSSTG